MTPAELAAREAIRDLVARYNALGDAGRIDELVALFADDAELEVEPGGVHRGRSALRALFAGAARPEPGTGGDHPEPDAGGARDTGGEPRRIAHHVSGLVIDLEGADRARGRAVFLVLAGRGLDHWGRYRDEYVREGGEAGRWRFARRRVVVDGAVPGGWGATRLHRSGGAPGAAGTLVG